MEGSGEPRPSVAARRAWQPRPAEMATIGSAVFVMASALLPSAAGSRPGLLLAGAAVIAYSLIWYRVLPPGAFGSWRYEIAGSFSQLIGMYTIAITGGVASNWFTFYLLPVLATVFSYRPRATLVIGFAGAAGIVACALIAPVGGDPGVTRDFTLLRLLQFGAVTSMALLVTRAMRRDRARLVAREGDLRDALANTAREALTDPLTGVHNRRSLEQSLTAVASRAARAAHPYALLLVDVDGLKALNDRAGHAAGDAVLRLVGRAATEVVRAYDLVARFGGDEFVVVLNDTTDESAHRTGERIQQRFSQLLAERPDLVGAAISVGAATWSPGRTANDLLNAADEEMYAAKRARREKQKPDV